MSAGDGRAERTVFEERAISSLVTRLMGDAFAQPAKDRLESHPLVGGGLNRRGRCNDDRHCRRRSKSSFLDLQYARRESALLSLRVVMMGRKGSKTSRPSLFRERPRRRALEARAVKRAGRIDSAIRAISEPYHVPSAMPSTAAPRDRSARGLSNRSTQRRSAIDDPLRIEAQEDFPREDARHRIEHCQMAAQLDEMKELISPSPTPLHATGTSSAQPA